MPEGLEQRSASPAKNGKKRDEDDCSDFEEQPPPAKQSKKLKGGAQEAVMKANGEWPMMSGYVGDAEPSARCARCPCTPPPSHTTAS